MIVDCHTHIDFPDNQLDFDTHISGCEQADYVFVLAPNTDSNKIVSRYIASFDKMIGFAAFNPLKDKVDVESVAAVLNKGRFQGAVIYPSQRGFHPCHTRAFRFYEAAVELGIPVFFHNSIPTTDAVMAYAQPMLIDEIAIEFPELKIILGSMAAPFFDQAVHIIGKHENVFGDLTVRPEKVWQTYNTVLKAHEAGIMQKLIFGSGFPAATAQSCIETLLGFNKLLANTNLPTVPRESIRGIIERNAFELLGMDIPVKYGEST
jgi:predicted TIM-barrel fold metal-dependent hydrolase